MNNKLTMTYFILMIATLDFGCGESVKSEKKDDVSTSSSSMWEKYAIDTKQSVITWEGSMVMASEKEHVGYVYISKGELMVENGQLVGGAAEIDMNTIEYKDKEDKNTPVKHLKSPDYFDVAKFPHAAIEITKVAPVKGDTISVTANLTIKGVERAVTFPATINTHDGNVKANGKLVIDRTDWGIRYNSGKFYDVVADQVVSDDIKFDIKIVANK